MVNSVTDSERQILTFFYQVFFLTAIGVWRTALPRDEMKKIFANAQIRKFSKVLPGVEMEKIFGNAQWRKFSKVLPEDKDNPGKKRQDLNQSLVRTRVNPQWQLI